MPPLWVFIAIEATIAALQIHHACFVFGSRRVIAGDEDVTQVNQF